MKKVFWGAVVLLFLFSGMAFADTANEAFEKGAEAFLNGDYITAAKWLHKAAEQGDADAQYILGLMYYEGKGVPQNFAETAKWFLKAAEQGDAYAQYNLGLMYYNGKGVPQSYMQSYIWLSIAAANLSGDLREKIVKIMDAVVKDLSPKQLEEAQKIASEWKPKMEPHKGQAYAFD